MVWAPPMSLANRPALSVVAPCYDEQDVLPEFLRRAGEVLDGIGITTNKQVIPDDPRPPMRPSGLRIGTPAITTRGMTETDMSRIAAWLVAALRYPDAASRLLNEVKDCAAAFPVPAFVP